MSRVFLKDPFTRLLLRFAKGRSLCNCNEAYAGKVEAYIHIGGCWGKKMVPGCPNGCSANQIKAKEEVAKEVCKLLNI